MKHTITFESDRKYTIPEILELLGVKYSVTTESENKPSPFYSVKQVADMLGVTDATVRNYIESGRLKATKLTERSTRISESQFKQFVEGRRR